MAWDTEMTLSDFYVYNFVTFFNTISMYLIHRSAKLIIVIELVNVRINNFVPGKFLVNKILLILEQLGTCRLVVVLQDKTYVYDLNSLAILDSIDTVPNLKGICAFSPSLDGCFLALPASTTKGSVLVYNVMELHSHCEIEAHRSPLAAIVLSSTGMYIATASEQGTIVRVHLVSEATKVGLWPIILDY